MKMNNGRAAKRKLCKQLAVVMAAFSLLLNNIIFIGEKSSFLEHLAMRIPSSSSFTKTQKLQQQQQDGHKSFLNVRPVGLNQCATVRFRSDIHPTGANKDTSYKVDEAMEILRQQRIKNGNDTRLSVGLVFVDNPNFFVSLKSVFHFFHFVEFLVVAYTELHRLQAAMTGTTEIADIVDANEKGMQQHAAATLKAVQVPWLYVPLFTRQEICGAAQGINCLILQMVLKANITEQQQQEQQQQISGIDIFGVESNDNITRQVHEAFTGILKKRDQKGVAVDPLRRNELQSSSADLVLLVDRQSCKLEAKKKQNLGKIWTHYIADNVDDTMSQRPSRRFPAEQWHADVQTALGYTLYPHSSVGINNRTQKEEEEESKIGAASALVTVCYIDRQRTNRRLPDSFHNWLVEYLQSHPQFDFLHVHMERYAALDQLRLAASCRIMLGVHGNGLSHVAWMTPQSSSALVEFFFDFQFRYDYCTLSQLFGLRYFALWNGFVLNPERLARRDPQMLREFSRFSKEAKMNPLTVANRLQLAQPALQDFLESILNESTESRIDEQNIPLVSVRIDERSDSSIVSNASSS